MKAMRSASSVSPTAASRYSSGERVPPWAAVTPRVKIEDPEREKAWAKVATPPATNSKAKATRLKASHEA